MAGCTLSVADAGAGCRQNEPDTVAGIQEKQTGCGEARQESGKSVTVVAIAASDSLRYLAQIESRLHTACVRLGASSVAWSHRR